MSIHFQKLDQLLAEAETPAHQRRWHEQQIKQCRYWLSRESLTPEGRARWESRLKASEQKLQELGVSE